jgi:enoyl-CoA hydratase/carnithine racemase
MYRKILFELRDGVARITLNRPEKRNALDGELVGELKAALGATASDPQCRVVVLAGAGTDFCSGADLAAFIPQQAKIGLPPHQAKIMSGGDPGLAGAPERSAENGVLDNMAEARATAELSGGGIRAVRLSRGEHRLCAGDGDGDPAAEHFRKGRLRAGGDRRGDLRRAGA